MGEKMTITEILFAVSGVSMLLGALGLFRFPDVYTRMHASTMITVGGVVFSLILFALNPFGIMFSIKILIIAAFMLATAPVSSHAIALSAYERGIRPEKAVVDELKNHK